MKVFSGDVTIYQFPYGEDNFGYLLVCEHEALAVDPGSPDPFLAFLEEHKEIKLGAILITHGHHDHIGGVAKLKEETGCTVIGPASAGIKELDQDVDEEECSFGPFDFQVVRTPGHSPDSILYHFPTIPALFTGDTLFLAGCGMMISGTAEELFASLQKIKDYSEETLIFGGHNYVESNLAFARIVEPNNEIIKALQTKIKIEPITYSTLKEELEYNPFLRTTNEEIMKSTQTDGGISTFRKLREMKDQFKIPS